MGFIGSIIFAIMMAFFATKWLDEREEQRELRRELKDENFFDRR